MTTRAISTRWWPRGRQACGPRALPFHRHARKIEEVCYLQNLHTAPEARGPGIGRALIEAVHARADAAGALSVYWLTQDFTVTARQLHDRIGQVTPFIRRVRKT